jgi:hypothetical protein
MATTGIEAIGMIDPISIEKTYPPLPILDFPKVDYRVLARREL